MKYCTKYSYLFVVLLDTFGLSVISVMFTEFTLYVILQAVKWALTLSVYMMKWSRGFLGHCGLT